MSWWFFIWSREETPMEEKLTLSQALTNGLKQSYKVLFKIIRIIIPIYIFVQLLAYLDVLPAIAAFLEPTMRIFGLPGEAAIVIILANGINIYAGIGAIGAIAFTTKQITILAVMITTSHSLFIETSIVKGLKINPVVQVLLRIGMMIVLGVMMNFLWR